MITSLHNVDQEFYKIICESNLITAPVLSIPTFKLDKQSPPQQVVLKIPVIFARKSAFNYSEKSFEQYPMISVENFTPTLRRDLERSQQPYLGGYKDTDADDKFDTVAVYEAPSPLEFRYEVNIACKAESEWDAIKKYFMAKYGFNRQKHFKLNKVSVPLMDNLYPDTTDIGDFCYYTFDQKDIFRSDGIFETLFTFVLLVWVDLNGGVEKDLAQEVDININGPTQVTITQPVHG